MELKDKGVLIAGGSGVLGAEIARLLDARGARLLLAGRDRERLAQVATSLSESPIVETFEMRSPGSIDSLVGRAVDAWGRLDGVVNATGVVAFGPIGEYPEEIIDDVISTNLLGPLHMMATAARQMESGFYVNITGVVAESPVNRMAPYVAAKAGLSAATRSLALELKRKGLLIVDARPPHTETGLASRSVFGAAPRFPEGLEPALVAEVIVEAIESETREVPSSRFETASASRAASVV